MTLQNVLHHPIYAGAYRWGYRKIDPRKQQPGRPNTGKTVHPPESCEVLIKDRFPAYISWDRFASIQQRLGTIAVSPRPKGCHAKVRLCWVVSCGVGDAVVAWRLPTVARPIICVTRACGRRLIMERRFASASPAPF
jgi:hypothetical protein